ncbi:MAG: NADH-quinone oxidoreductase subunit NuoE [Clostridiaceae bacterium]|nr:NADH-quinone oxidoreductase subunit NuoE [Clostridiaceae bacterium]
MLCCKENGDKIEAIIEKHRNNPGSIITILQEVQEVFNYLPKDVLAIIAEKTKIKPAKIYGVATFYKQFRLNPIGKYLILLCQGTACHVNGSKKIEETLYDELKIKDGETTEDGLFTLNNVACLGCCSLSPVMMINEETYGSLTPEHVAEIIRELKNKENRQVV